MNKFSVSSKMHISVLFQRVMQDMPGKDRILSARQFLL